MSYLNHCRICKSEDIVSVINLNNQPLANSFCKKDEIQDSYPLELYVCSHCFHCQLNYVVDKNILFKNYIYVSGTSNTLNKYFDFFANYVENLISNKGKILEIACNDGSQLNKFKKLGWETYGVDPAENLYTLSKENHNIICDFWNNDCAEKIGKVDCIVAQNVLGHTNDVHDFLQNCKKCMNNDTYLFIQTSQANMIERYEFDTIYHEHLSFFSIKSMQKLVELNGLNLIDVFTHSIHGTSYIFVIRLNKEIISSNVMRLYNEEETKGRYNIQTYSNFLIKCHTIKNDLITLVSNYKNQGYKIIGYGAAAKGMTLLNFCNIKLDVIYDDNPLKWELYTPGTLTNIKSIDKIKELENEKVICIPLAWNFYSEIIQKYLDNRKNYKDISIRYFPYVKEEKLYNKILLLGGCGYIGSRLYNYLNKYYDVTSIDNEQFGKVIDTNIKKDIKDITENTLKDFNVIILLCGNSSVKMCENKIMKTFNENVKNFVHILSMIKAHQKFIYASSSSVYGNYDKIAVENNEEYIPNNNYDLSKQVIDLYAKSSNIEYYGLRFGTVAGISPNLRIDTMINSMVYNAFTNKEIKIYNPEIQRPILGINDLCRGIYKIVKTRDNKKGLYNMASFNCNVLDIGTQISQIMNIPYKLYEKEDIKNISNVKLQTNAYNFSISIEKFEKVFDFTFNDTISSIVSELCLDWDNIKIKNTRF